MNDVVFSTVVGEKKFLRRFELVVGIECVMKGFHEVGKHVVCDFSCFWCKGEVGCAVMKMFW